jgi:hypothetical protein
MNLLKTLSSKFVELFFIVLSLIWVADAAAGGIINYPIIAVLAVLVVQLLIPNRFVGIGLGLLLMAGSFYMFLAALSDYYAKPSDDGLRFMAIWTLICSSGMTVAFAMVRKYVIQWKVQLLA